MIIKQDALGGLLFVVLGLAAILIAADYEFGTARQMGPGYFPVVLGGLIAVLGAALFASAVLAPQKGERFTGLALRPLVLVLAAVVAFSMLIRPAGLVVSILAVIVIGRLAGRHVRIAETAAMAIVLIVVCSVVFVYGLGMPLRLLPW